MNEKIDIRKRARQWTGVSAHWMVRAANQCSMGINFIGCNKTDVITSMVDAQKSGGFYHGAAVDVVGWASCMDRLAEAAQDAAQYTKGVMGRALTPELYEDQPRCIELLETLVEQLPVAAQHTNQAVIDALNKAEVLVENYRARQGR